MQAVYNIPEICARHGITDVVLSPGSRSAPLTLAFARHPAYHGKLRVVPDERAAAFIGLGIAQATRRPVVLVCTSGTAGLNYAPAVAEAFFQQIPLLILTADRPPEWIDQLDGQTIRQRHLYGPHAKAAFDFPADTSHPDAKWHAGRIINEAINLAQAAPAGPVQVNIPLREPFYPKEEITYEQDVKIIKQYFPAEATLQPDWLELKELITASDKTLVVLGQQQYEADTYWALHNFINTKYATVVADCLAQVNASDPVRYHDVFLPHVQPKKFQPDLLITFGLSLISKSLKLFLRRNPPKHHIHILPAGPTPDTFESLTHVVYARPADFLTQLVHGYEGGSQQPANDFHRCWSDADAEGRSVLRGFLRERPAMLTEFAALDLVLPFIEQLADKPALHLANSMAVRYANILGLEILAEVFANRGTSGIDGCTSTAVGAALAQPARPVVLLTGDVAFFYDRNAFWHNYPLPNLRVVLFNNHGGGIFRLIDGPRQQPELEEFFETRQTLTAENTARDFGLRYFPVSTFAELEAALPVFFAAEGGAALLEIFTDSKTNAAFFEEYRKAVKTAFSNPL